MISTKSSGLKLPKVHGMINIPTSNQKKKQNIKPLKGKFCKTNHTQVKEEQE